MKLASALIAAALCVSSLTFSPVVAAEDVAPVGIAWQQGDVDAAFALAKASNKPIFLYWGAVWCPYCNQVKATIFTRQDFIERSRFFVPVYIDGDSPSAQKLGTRFKVSGYPTMILFKPDGTEVTRLPGEVDGARYLQLLELGMNATHSVADSLKRASAGEKLTPDEWRILSYYTWDSGEQQLVSKDELPATLQNLAKACPVPEIALRLQLKAWAAMGAQKPGQRPALDSAAALERLHQVLADPRQTRDNMDVLAYGASELTELLAAGPEQQKLIAAFDAAFVRLMKDQGISKSDRVALIGSQISLARVAIPKGALPAELVQAVQQRVGELDKSTSNLYERQAVISSAARALTDVGLIDQSDTLLKAELKRSQAPYYYMLGLASNAKVRDDKTAALSWYEQAYQAAKGPATRLQWGASYLTNLLDLAPQDEERIAKAAQGVLTELAATRDAFYTRNRGALGRIGKKLTTWNADGKHQQVFGKVQSQLNDICAKTPEADGQRSACESILGKAKSS
jgi:thiol-disulfide isomerase/thioredoxin